MKGPESHPASRFPGLSREECLNLLHTIVEYLPEVPRHLKAMDHPAKHSERKSILDRIHDQGAALNFGKPMCVAPKLVGAPRLDIDEFVRWIPPLDFRQPTKRNPPDAQRVGVGRSWLHHDGRRSENSEVHPRGSEWFQILRAGEEIENRR